MKSLRLSIYVLMLVSILAAAASADRVYTRNGTWEGIVVDETSENIDLEISDGSIIKIPKANIREIEYTAAEDAGELLSEIESLKQKARSASERGELKEALSLQRVISDKAGRIRERAGSDYYERGIDIKDRAEAKAEEIRTELDAQDVFIEEDAGPEEKLKEMGVDLTAAEFVKAAGEGSIEILELFIEAGFEVNSAGPGGRTALMEACARGRIETAEKLLSAGAEVNLEDESGATALHLAIESGNTPPIDLIVEKTH